MTGLPWASDIELTVERVRAILSRQLPALSRIGRVAYLDEGWDNVVFEVASTDATWLLRFPKRDDVVPSLLVERALLPYLAARLPRPVPSFELRGEPGELFPRPFAGYHKLAVAPGGATPLEPGSIAPLARELSELLTALHSVPVSDAIARGVPSKTRHRALGRLRDRVLERVHLAREAAPHLASRVESFLTAPLPEPFSGEPRLIHADFTGTHVLLEGTRITGVIDWADTEVGDPAVDLAGAYHWGGEALFGAVIERYPFGDDGLAARARFVATCVGFYDLFYGVEAGIPEQLERGVRVLDALLDP